MGDPCGAGWKILQKLLGNQSKFFNPGQSKKLSELVIIGDLFESEEKIIKKLFHIISFEINPSDNHDKLIELILNEKSDKPLFIALTREKSSTLSPSLHLAERSYFYFITAMQLWKNLSNSSLVTLPVSKELIIKSGHQFSGHTEEIERLWNKKGFMCMYHPELSIIPLTNHVPLRKVPDLITRLDKASLLQSLLFFQGLFKPKRKTGLTGLNPHAGEDGTIGTEESYLKSTIMYMKKEKLAIEGPLSADAAFLPGNRKNFNLIIACYHDQALIPFKALYGAEGLNITLNMPKLRVSPDHGPAYDCVAQNKCDTESVFRSILFAMEWGEKWIKQYSFLL